jgi:hypothetical protein
MKINLNKFTDDELIELSEKIDAILIPMLQDDFLKKTNYKSNIDSNSRRVMVRKQCISGKLKSKKIGSKRFPYLKTFFNNI